MSADVQMTDAAPLRPEGAEGAQQQGGEDTGGTTQTAGSENSSLPFWAAVDASERAIMCPTCGFPTKFDLATANLEVGSWAWIVFDTIQRIHAVRVGEIPHLPTFSADEVYSFVQRHYSGSTPEWALAVQETLRSMPQLFPPVDEATQLYTVKRMDNLEELAIFALSNAPAEPPKEEEKKGIKRSHSQVAEGGGDDDDDVDGDKKPGKEKNFFCFAPDCTKAFTRLDSLRQHLSRLHPGYSVDAKFNLCGPNGQIFGQLPRKTRKTKANQDGVFPCPAPGCGKFYSSEAVAKAHMKKLHPNVEVPKKIDPVPSDSVPASKIARNDSTTELHFQGGEASVMSMKNPSEMSSMDESRKARREGPQFPPPKLYPTYSFTTIPTTDFLSVLINQHNGVVAEPPQPSYLVPVATPVDWDKLKALMSSSIGKQGAGA